MKSAMGAVVALALGIGLAASAGATGMNRQGAMQSPNIQTGSTQQIQQKQIRPQRHAVQKQTQQRKLALVRGHRVKGKMALAQKQRIGKTRLATLKRHSRMQFAKLHRGKTMQLARLHQKAGKTRVATLHRRNQNQNQAVGVGSSMPNTGNTTITQPTPNSAGSSQNLNTQPQNK
jgi:hypothetical protein